MRVIIMRGLPGAGKSEMAARHAGDHETEICSADDHHVGLDGVYRFDPKKAGAAHTECLRKYMRLLSSGFKGDVIVDNTNTTLAEIAPYARIAEAHGVEFTIVYIHCDPATACRRNVHAVPPATILRMYKNLLQEEVPPYWKQEVICQ